MSRQEVDAGETDAPLDSIDAIALDRQRRRKRLVFGGGGLVLLACGGALGLLHVQDAAATARVDGAWSGFSRCMVGPPIEQGQSASLRFRALQLGVMNVPEAQRAPQDGKPWPDRCASLGHAVKEALQSAGRADKEKKDLAYWTEHLAKVLKEDKDPAGADFSEPIENAWIAAQEATVSIVPSIDVTPPPVAAIPLTADALASVEPLSKSAFPLAAAHTDLHPGLVLRLLIEDKSVPRSPFLCTWTGSAPAPTCAGLPDAIGKTHGLRLLGTADDDAAPLVFAGHRGGDGVFRADTGDLIESIYAYGGYAKKDGHAAVLGWDEARRDLRLTRKTPDGPRVQEVIDPSFEVGNFFYSSQILWDDVLLRGITKSDERRLFAQKVAWKGAQGEPVDIGELPEPGLVESGDETPHITGCRTAEATTVRVKGYDNDFMSFRIGGKWTQPISPDLTGGLLSCHGAEATITRLEPAAEDAAWKTSVTQIRCTSAGCRGDLVKMEQLIGTRFQLAPREGHVDAASLDGKLLMVWAAGDRGGVRMRFAAPAQMAATPDVVIYDDLVKDGRAQRLSTLFDLRLFSRQGFAVLLLSTVQGVHALRIGSDGVVTPVGAVWGKGP